MYTVVCCYGWDLNCIHTVVIVVWYWCLLYVRVGLLVLLLLLLLLLATLLVATVYGLLYVSEYGVLLLAIHIPERLAAACYLLWSFLTKYKTCQETSHFRQNPL